MRIVIEIDGDDVQVHTDRQSRESGSADVVDAGSAPMDLLRQHGEIDESTDAARPPRGKQGAIKPAKDTPLNPLRAGQAIARKHRVGGVEPNAESEEVVDGGHAPKLPSVSGKDKPSKGNAPKQRSRKK
jgi:hypothetical protein